MDAETGFVFVTHTRTRHTPHTLYLGMQLTTKIKNGERKNKVFRMVAESLVACYDSRAQQSALQEDSLTASVFEKKKKDRTRARKKK